jgi:hypothetical protein
MAVAGTAPAGVGVDGPVGAGGTGDGAREAGEKAALRGIITIHVAGRRIDMLPPEQIGFLVGLGLLAAVEIIEWPVAVVLAVGHTLAYRSQRAGLRTLGAVLEKV